MAKNQIKRNKPGQPTKLNKTLGLRIRKLFLEGFKPEQIQEKLEIKMNTWNHWYWNNTQSFRDNLTMWRREKIYRKAEQNLEEFAEMPTEIQDIEDSDAEDGPRSVVVTDPRLLKIKLDATTYITDTLGKETYSKKLITEDPSAAKSEEVEEIRQRMKNMFNIIKGKYRSNHIEKMKTGTKK